MKSIYLVVAVFFMLISCKEAKKEQKVEVKEIAKEVVETEVEDNNEEMVYFDGGKINIGSKNLPSEQPIFEMEIAPFYLDKNLVTVAEFRVFVTETSHVTEADKYGDSGVFSFKKNSWELLKGANWEFPLGKDKPKAIDNHPVTHVSWNDAKAYAAWKGKRLPTEFEWEFAAKNSKNNNDKYSWGHSIEVDGKYQANVWQGSSIQDKEVLDGFLLTSPVGTFPASASGLFDMGGNVWQWCDSYFKPYPFNESVPPQSPNVRSTRGGSFMFDQALENSYTTTFRGQNSIDTSLFNMGFRCAK